MVGTWVNPQATNHALYLMTLLLVSFFTLKTHFLPTALTPSSLLITSQVFMLVRCFSSSTTSFYLAQSDWECTSLIVHSSSPSTLAVCTAMKRAFSCSKCVAIRPLIVWTPDGSLAFSFPIAVPLPLRISPICQAGLMVCWEQVRDLAWAVGVSSDSGEDNTSLS